MPRLAVVWPIQDKRSITVFAGRKGEVCCRREPSSTKGERNLLGNLNEQRAWLDYSGGGGGGGRRRRQLTHPFWTPRTPGQIMTIPVTPMLV